MVEDRKIYLFCLVIGFVVVIGLASSNSFEVSSQSDGKTNQVEKNTSSVERNSASWEAEVTGRIIYVDGSDNNLEQVVKNTPLPEIELVFAQNKNSTDRDSVKIELPQEAKDVLYKHWLLHLKYQYENKVPPVEKIDYMNRDIQLSQSTINTKANLEKILINAPDGARVISNKEARKLVTFIGEASNEVINSQKPLY